MKHCTVMLTFFILVIYRKSNDATLENQYVPEQEKNRHAIRGVSIESYI